MAVSDHGSSSVEPIPGQPAVIINPYASTSARNYALVLLTVVYSFNFIDRQLLSILQESIKLELALSDSQLGLLTGFAFAIFYVTAGIPIARWADRSNRRNIVAMAIGLWSLMTAISGLAQNYTQLLAARIGVGVGEARSEEHTSELQSRTNLVCRLLLEKKKKQTQKNKKKNKKQQ